MLSFAALYLSGTWTPLLLAYRREVPLLRVSGEMGQPMALFAPHACPNYWMNES